MKFGKRGCLPGLVLLSLVMGFVMTRPCTARGEGVQLNSNDISFLWPAPRRASDLSGLIALDEKLSGGVEIWPPPLFLEVIAAAPGVQATAHPNAAPSTIAKFKNRRIEFPAGEEVELLSSWRIAGIRIDPSAPGCDPSLIGKFGSTPQIRLVVQPILSRGNQFRVHDIAAHLAFDLTEAPGRPDKAAFLAVVKDLVELKQQLQAAGVTTDEQLGVHPGFANPSVDLPGKLRAFLKKHLKPERLNTIAFMGIKRPEPWFFFVMRKGPAGFVISEQSNSHKSLSEIFVRGESFPAPDTKTFGDGLGVSTAPLLRGAALDDDATGMVPLVQRPIKMKEIPDIIANPRLTHVINTNCISCHTESGLRSEQSIEPAAAPLAFAGPGSKENALPGDTWNVRNFGWGDPRGAQATATLRTANEAAESAEFINREYLASAPAPMPGATGNPATPVTPAAAQHKPVSNALTLIVTAKSPQEYTALKTKITQLQAAPPEANPIFKALEKLEKVHFARFVFVDEGHKVMVITTFDDDFDTYIDLFVDEIGTVFDLILAHVKDAPPLPVSEHREEFRQFVRKHDAPITGTLYSAYPKLRASDIKAANIQPAP